MVLEENQKRGVERLYAAWWGELVASMQGVVQCWLLRGRSHGSLCLSTCPTTNGSEGGVSAACASLASHKFTRGKVEIGLGSLPLHNVNGRSA
jgi:hypothetical protein